MYSFEFTTKCGTLTVLKTLVDSICNFVILFDMINSVLYLCDDKVILASL